MPASKKMLENLTQLLVLFSKLILLLVIMSIFIPFSPKLPAAGIDSSWALGLNQALAQGLAFGKQIIFTLGPYSSIYTKAYHPATHIMMNAGSLYLALSYWGALLLLMKNTRWYWILLCCIPLFGMLYARDSLFFSYMLLAGLISFKLMSQSGENSNAMWRIALLFAPFGLFALIKGSTLLLCFSVLAVCFVFFWINTQRRFALICLSSALASMILFWLAANQSLVNLPLYLTSSVSIASSFSDAMSLPGNNNEVLLYFITSCCITLFILFQKRLSGLNKLFLCCILLSFLFISFKTGFTRHAGHAFIPGTSVLLAGIFLALLFRSGMAYFILFLSLGCWNYINGHYTRISIPENFKSSYSATWHGLKSSIQDPQWLENNFAFALSFLRDQANFPVLQGSTDIYSYNQAYLIASQNTWSPRPIFQSYSVFNTRLAEKNKQFLDDKHRPDNIIFKIEPIDARLPSLEDGTSWPLLLSHYYPAKIQNDFLFLQKRKNRLQNTEVLLGREHPLLGERVRLPKQRKPVFATLEIQPTIPGKLASIIFRSSQLEITLYLKNGALRHYRLIANMAKSGFLLSPLIESTREFSLLYEENNIDLNEKKVTAFMVTSSTDNSWFWHQTYTLRFYSKT